MTNKYHDSYHMKHEGVDVSGVKITANKVVNIKHLYASGVKQYEIAKLYNLHQSNISLIVNNKRWGHLSW